jgi:hypothetical protein
MIVQGGTRQVHAFIRSQPGAAAGDHCAAELTVAAEGYVQPQAGCFRSSTRLVMAGHCGPRAAKSKRVGGTCYDLQCHVAVTWIRRRCLRPLDTAGVVEGTAAFGLPLPALSAVAVAALAGAFDLAVAHLRP